MGTSIKTWPLLILIALDLAGFGMVLADIQLRAEHAHASGWMIGAILSSMFVVQLFASPLWGRVADARGRKPVVLFCTCLSALSMAVYAFSDNLTIILASRILAGFAAANVSVAQAWIGDEVPEDQRTTAMGRIGAAVTAGLVVGTAVGGFLAHFGGNRILGLTAAACSGLGILLVTVFTRDHQSTRTKEKSSAPAKRLFENRELAALMGLAAIAWFSLACLEGTFARLLEHRWHQDQIAFGIVTAYEAGLGFIVQAWLISALTRKFTDFDLVKYGLLLQGAGLASMPFFPTFGLVFIGSGIYSFGSSLFSPSINSWCGRITPDELQATMYGTLQSARSFGFIVGPTLGGALFDRDNRLPYLSAGIVCVIGSAISAKIAKSSDVEIPLISTL